MSKLYDIVHSFTEFYFLFNNFIGVLFVSFSITNHPCSFVLCSVCVRERFFGLAHVQIIIIIIVRFQKH